MRPVLHERTGWTFQWYIPLSTKGGFEEAGHRSRIPRLEAFGPFFLVFLVRGINGRFPELPSPRDPRSALERWSHISWKTEYLKTTASETGSYYFSYVVMD